MISDQEPPFETIVFDCDSTLSAVEGIDELAGEQIATISELTRRAMDGEISLDEVYGRRLEMIHPNRSSLERVAARYVEELVPGIKELFGTLIALKKRLAIVSGGLLPAVVTVADALGVDRSSVHAVDIYFDEGGAYAGFESNSPLTRSGGKLEVLAKIASAPEAGAVALVGDGVTDLEALPAIARFVAWGGVVHRDDVHQRSACSCDGPDARDLLNHLLSDSERAALSEAASNA